MLEKLGYDIEYIVPSLRIGNASFGFSINDKAFQYRGQVEIDAVIWARDKVFAIELKSIKKNSKMFKHKIVFSIQALANALNNKVYPILGLNIKEGYRTRLYSALLLPEAEPNKIYEVNVETSG